jgi:inner membrane protein
MDPLTHTATGLFLSRAGLKRATPGATAILLLAANAPDVDVVTAFGGPLEYLNYHRHLTHSLLAAPVMALLPVLLVRYLGRRPVRWLPAFFISLLGVASHLALDYTNKYGIRLLLPFSAEWLRADWTCVIDPWIWAALALALVAPLISRLVNLEIGSAARRNASPGRGFAIFALLFLAGYNGARAVLHARAVAVLESRLYEGRVPARVAALPTPLNPLVWDGVVETPEFYSVHVVNLATEFDPTRGRVFYRAPATPEQQAAARTTTFRDFSRFVQYPMWRTVPGGTASHEIRVEAFDMRFGTPLRPGFVAVALLGSDRRVIRTWFTFGDAPAR